MPTTDIIGYLWHNRQALELDGISDALQMAVDLQLAGLECVRINEERILGTPVTARTQLILLEHDEWDTLVHAAIVSASVSDTVHMTERGDGDHR